MACSVFGTLITDETLKGMSKYHDKNITRLDRATVAFEMKNAEGKDVSAHKYLDEIRGGVSEECLSVVIYNATGGAVRLVNYLHGDGCVGPSPIPMIIGNGQWGAYVHTVDRPQRNHGGHALVFAGRNAAGTEQQWMFVMEANWPGRCFTEIRPANYYPLSNNNYGTYGNLLSSSVYNHRATSQGCSSFATIGCGTKSPFFEGIMTLDNSFGW